MAFKSLCWGPERAFGEPATKPELTQFPWRGFYDRPGFLMWCLSDLVIFMRMYQLRHPTVWIRHSFPVVAYGVRCRHKITVNSQITCYKSLKRINFICHFRGWFVIYQGWFETSGSCTHTGHRLQIFWRCTIDPAKANYLHTTKMVF